jgi:hypothetical protein
LEIGAPSYRLEEPPKPPSSRPCELFSKMNYEKRKKRLIGTKKYMLEIGWK